MSDTDTVTLDVRERFLLLALLPREASLATIKISRELREALSFSEEEHAAYGIQIRDDQVAWTQDGTRAIPVGPAAREIIVTALKRLDQEQKVTADHLSLFEKFLPDGDGHG